MGLPYDIEVVEGEDKSIRDTMEPVVDVSAWTVSLYIKRDLSSNNPSEVLLTIVGTITDGPNGVSTYPVTAAQTTTLGVGTFYYEIRRTNTGFNSVITSGKFIVKPAVAY